MRTSRAVAVALLVLSGCGAPDTDQDAAPEAPVAAPQAAAPAPAAQDSGAGATTVAAAPSAPVPQPAAPAATKPAAPAPAKPTTQATAKPTPTPAQPAAPAPAQPTAPAAPSSGLPAGVTPAMVTAGGAAFGTATCAGCHGPQAAGVPGIGPNLTDQAWLNIDGSFASIVQAITNGVPSPKESMIPMPPKGGVTGMTDQQVRELAAYIYSRSHGG